MKTLPLVLASLVVCLSAAEESRTWTNDKGQKIVGTLMAKDDTTADIMLKTGKRTPVKIATLVKADQDYIAKAEVHPDPLMMARTVAHDNDTAKTKDDARSVEVDLSRIHGRKYEVTIHWLGPMGNKVGIYKSETRKVDADGKFTLSVVYDGRKSRKGIGHEYKGYVVGLWGDAGFADGWVSKSASQKPFERFLDE